MNKLKIGTLAGARKELSREAHKASLLRQVYQNWIPIWFYSSIRRKRNVSQAKLRSNVTVRAKRGHRFNNLMGLAQLIQHKWRILEVTEDYINLEDSRTAIRMKCRLNVGFDISFVAFVFVEKVYRKDFRGKTVIDAGSYIGDTAVYFATNGATRVIGLEPYINNLNLAQENVNRLNKLGDRITLLQAALSSKDGEADFRIFESEPNGNRIAINSNNQGETIRAKAMTIESVMREFGLGRVDVLKMNCEGAEYDIIESLSNKTASLIDEIYVEFHQGPEKIIRILEKLGYKVDGETRKNKKYGHLRALNISRFSLSKEFEMIR